MKLTTWAKQQGITYRTAWRWVKENRMPVPFTITPTGSIFVDEAVMAPTNERVALYARVSSADQKADLDRQVARLATHASAAGLSVVRTVAEIGSAMNGRRPQLLKVLADPAVSVILVEHRDRLTRFGFEYIEAALHAQGRRIVVLDETETADDLVRDMMEVLTSFCARLYDRRSARNRAKRAMAAMEEV